MTQYPAHLAISASAGTGKTFQLAHRFIHLVLLGEPPERIIALTFSRKAAREIFDRVILLLSDAARSPELAAVRNRFMPSGDWTTDDYRAALRRLLITLPRSRVGTIDSFMVGVVRAFPFELGLEPDFQVFDNEGVEAQICRREALRRVLLHAATNPLDRERFFEAFKFATFGHEEKRSTQLLNRLMTYYQGLYRLQPHQQHWGLDVYRDRPTFPDHAAWIDGILRVEAMIDIAGWGKTALSFWREFCEDVKTWQPDLEFSTRIDYVTERILPVMDQLGQRVVPLKFGRDEFVLSVEFGAALLPVLHYMGDLVVQWHSIRAKGMFHLIDRCESVYDEHIRRRGFLTFEDALYVLRQQPLGLQTTMTEPERLAIDYRLDGKLDHWLLDEFQDTSTLQWQVLSNLVDEVIQDSEKRRTFFYVGDVKQAIYGWRGGNAALFDHILRHYNQSEAPVIQRQPLDQSYRSCQPIIEVVNRVFGALSPRIDSDVRAAWATSWHDHSCAASVPERGYAALIELPKPEQGEETDDPDEVRFAAVADLLAEIRPLEKNLTVAILCRSNVVAKAVAHALRTRLPEVPVVLEGHTFIADNPVVSLLLSVLQWAEHPGDLFALRHVQIGGLTPQGPDEAVAIREEIQLHGFHTTLKTWLSKIEARHPLTEYEVMRAGQLLELAAQQDRKPERHIDRFIAQARETTVEDAANRRAVRIMTIHKSKGLDFDVVFLPDLQGRGGGGGGPLISWSEDRTTPQWIMDYVRKHLLPLDARLMKAAEDEELRGGVEDLCVLYVAMTRAARALYLITTDQGTESRAANHAAYIKDALAVSPECTRSLGEKRTILMEAGDATWYEKISPPPTSDDIPEILDDHPLTFRMATDVRRAPSQAAEFEREASRVFASHMRERRELGSVVHEALKKIEWLDSPNDVAARLTGIPSPAAEHLRTLFGQPVVAEVFKRPTKVPEVWREQSFEIMVDEEWISGVFDRVVILRNDNGIATGAEIIDYKTNHIKTPDDITELTSHYRSQLESYRTVLAKLIDLSEVSIQIKLLFTETATMVRL